MYIYVLMSILDNCVNGDIEMIGTDLELIIESLNDFSSYTHCGFDFSLYCYKNNTTSSTYDCNIVRDKYDKKFVLVNNFYDYHRNRDVGLELDTLTLDMVLQLFEMTREEYFAEIDCGLK